MGIYNILLVINRPFRKVSDVVCKAAGSPLAFSISVTFIVGWALRGPKYHYSDTWQLVVNTTTTIITFLMVFLIQNTQNREMTALNTKLDELIRAVDGASKRLIKLEEQSDEEVKKIREELTKAKDEATKKTPKVIGEITEDGGRAAIPNT